MKKLIPFSNEKVKIIFSSYPEDVQEKLLAIRQLIFDVAQSISEVGEIEEAVRWGQPSYLTTSSKTGSLIRIDQVQEDPGSYAIYFHCQTGLVGMFRSLYPKAFTFVGNRALLFHCDDEIPVKELRHCIALALTYHIYKKSMMIKLK